MKVFLLIFIGASLYISWVFFWMGRNVNHNWPFLPCFIMGFVFPISLAIAIAIKLTGL